MNGYDFSPKTFNEFLATNKLDVQEAILAVSEEYQRLKKLKEEKMG